MRYLILLSFLIVANTAQSQKGNLFDEDLLDGHITVLQPNSRSGLHCIEASGYIDPAGSITYIPVQITIASRMDIDTDNNSDVMDDLDNDALFVEVYYEGNFKGRKKVDNFENMGYNDFSHHGHIFCSAYEYIAIVLVPCLNLNASGNTDLYVTTVTPNQSNDDFVSYDWTDQNLSCSYGEYSVNLTYDFCQIDLNFLNNENGGGRSANLNSDHYQWYNNGIIFNNLNNTFEEVTLYSIGGQKIVSKKISSLERINFNEFVSKFDIYFVMIQMRSGEIKLEKKYFGN